MVCLFKLHIMRKLIFLALFSLLLTGCIFNLNVDDKRYRIDVPVTVTNLGNTLNVGDTLLFSAQLKNPVEVVDRIQEKNSSKVTFPDSTILKLGLALYGPILNNEPYPNLMSPTQADSAFRLFAKAGSASLTPFSTVFLENAPNVFRSNFGIIVKKSGLYAIRLGGNPFKVPSLSGEISYHFTNKELNHNLLNESQKNNLSVGRSGHGLVVIYVR
ncbi:MAG: hypothetical protein EAZ14_00240 [Runella slithyformis]|nr:MAG: hypothetical protein EAZ14_00240 [Runella slithyformis]